MSILFGVRIRKTGDSTDLFAPSAMHRPMRDKRGVRNRQGLP